MTGVDTRIEILPADAPEMGSTLADLAEVLHACVHAGASVGFILPFDLSASAAFWDRHVRPGLAAGSTVLFVARRAGRTVGTVQLSLPTMPNQPHRADISKLLVHPDHRRLGIARQLMQSAETHARQIARTLLVLDTRSGDPSQQLYQNIGFEIAGEIPGYCRNPFRDVYEPTTYLFKRLT